MEDVVRTRLFVTDISRWEAVGRVHGEFFHTIKPVATMVEVSALISPELLVEIEVTAVVDA
jgi:enamine deaminase RidA (YjgF/YER057c/UK114 family)